MNSTNLCVIIKTFVCHKDHITTKLLVVRRYEQTSTNPWKMIENMTKGKYLQPFKKSSQSIL